MLPPNTQDVSRLCLSRAIVSGHLYADHCLVDGQTIDRSRYGGHLYSNKPPGMAVLEIAPAELVRLPAPTPTTWHWEADGRLWVVHLLASGLPFLLCVFCLGRVSEGLAPGYGGVALVTFGLGTQMGALGISGFDHALAAALAFGAFVLASRYRSLVAGLAAGAAVAVEYEALAILLLLLVYVGLQSLRRAAVYLASTSPGLVLLGAYDWAAFGAPWHTSYHYLDNSMRTEQVRGVLGVSRPSVHSTELVFVGNRGLLVLAPVLLAAAAGLALVWKAGYRPEALLCAAVFGLFLLAECGYFDPYGGRAPGPRFLGAALPFLAVGLGPAFARWLKLTSVLAALSIVASTAVALSWQTMAHYRQTVWGELARAVAHGGQARLLNNLAAFAPALDTNHIAAAGLIGGITIAAFVVALLGPDEIKRPETPSRSTA